MIKYCSSSKHSLPTEAAHKEWKVLSATRAWNVLAQMLKYFICSLTDIIQLKLLLKVNIHTTEVFILPIENVSLP